MKFNKFLKLLISLSLTGISIVPVFAKDSKVKMETKHQTVKKIEDESSKNKEKKKETKKKSADKISISELAKGANKEKLDVAEEAEEEKVAPSPEKKVKLSAIKMTFGFSNKVTSDTVLLAAAEYLKAKLPTSIFEGAPELVVCTNSISGSKYVAIPFLKQGTTSAQSDVTATSKQPTKSSVSDIDQLRKQLSSIKKEINSQIKDKEKSKDLKKSIKDFYTSYKSKEGFKDLNLEQLNSCLENFGKFGSACVITRFKLPENASTGEITPKKIDKAQEKTKKLDLKKDSKKKLSKETKSDLESKDKKEDKKLKKVKENSKTDKKDKKNKDIEEKKKNFIQMLKKVAEEKKSKKENSKKTNTNKDE